MLIAKLPISVDIYKGKMLETFLSYEGSCNMPAVFYLVILSGVLVAVETIYLNEEVN
jgi:hypothetical protein